MSLAILRKKGKRNCWEKIEKMIDNGVYCLSFLNKKKKVFFFFWTFAGRKHCEKRDFIFKTHFENEGRDCKESEEHGSRVRDRREETAH